MLTLTYTNLLLLKTFEDRLNYLKIGGLPSEITFGPLRHHNQAFYKSKDWKLVREEVIGRDLGFDLGIPGRNIFGRVIVHHMNPLGVVDLYNPELSLNPEYLITVSHQTHQAIHFVRNQIEVPSGERFPNDTKLW